MRWAIYTKNMLQPDAGTVLVFLGFVFAMYREGLSGVVLIVGFAAVVMAVLTILSGAGTLEYLLFGEANGIYRFWLLFVGLGAGVIAILFMHMLINVGMVLGLAPVIGIPLHFISHGGSSFHGLFPDDCHPAAARRRTLQRPPMNFLYPIVLVGIMCIFRSC